MKARSAYGVGHAIAHGIVDWVMVATLWDPHVLTSPAWDGPLSPVPVSGSGDAVRAARHGWVARMVAP